MVVMATVVVLVMEAVVVEAPVVLVLMALDLRVVQEVMVFKFQQYSKTQHLLLHILQVQTLKELVV
tara:strand:- start:250 stop:447 length:198 start_codon:yes stop_codon:yes gene_type:complete